MRTTKLEKQLLAALKEGERTDLDIASKRLLQERIRTVDRMIERQRDDTVTTLETRVRELEADNQRLTLALESPATRPQNEIESVLSRYRNGGLSKRTTKHDMINCQGSVSGLRDIRSNSPR